VCYFLYAVGSDKKNALAPAGNFAPSATGTSPSILAPFTQVYRIILPIFYTHARKSTLRRRLGNLGEQLFAFALLASDFTTRLQELVPWVPFASVCKKKLSSVI